MREKGRARKKRRAGRNAHLLEFPGERRSYAAAIDAAFYRAMSDGRTTMVADLIGADGSK
jgi:hypothetical protein